MLSFGEQKSVYFSVFYTVRWLWEPAVIIAVHLYITSLIKIICEPDAIFLSVFVFFQTSDEKPINSSWSITSSDTMWNRDYLNCSVNFMIHVCFLSAGDRIFSINACDYELWICFQCVFFNSNLAIAVWINKLAKTHKSFSENVSQHIRVSTFFAWAC